MKIDNELIEELEKLKHKETPPRSRKEIEAEVEKLIKEMTLEEKIGQLFFGMLWLLQDEDNEPSITFGPKQTIKNKDELKKIVGSILEIPVAKKIYQTQKKFLERNRLGIPLMFMFDVIHGFRTIFPIPLGLSCSWNMDLIEKSAKVAAKEAAVSGICVTFAPMLDLVRDPRWGRVMESPGEDPYLGKEYAKAMVRGFQGESLHKRDTIASCAKHFCAYGAAEGGRDYNTVDISERRLRNFYLPAFEGAVEQGVSMFMTSFNIYDGIPSTVNKFLYNQVLRNEWNFKGVVITDHSSLQEVIIHGAAKDEHEAAKLAIESNIDIELATPVYVNHLKSLVEEDVIQESIIDNSVRRVLFLKYNLGLFDDPFRYIDVRGERELHVCDEHRKIAREIARESIVLLKNNDILPLKKNLQTIAIIGPHADNRRIYGSWSALGKPGDTISLKSGVIQKLGKEVKVIVEKGCGFKKRSKIKIDKVKEAAEQADAIILALGETDDMSGEAKSRGYLNLPEPQERLAEVVMQFNKPTVLVLFNGRPLDIKWFNENVPAILEAWFPGTEGGNAIADIVFGDYNPSGKLTMSFPYTIGQIPVYYNHFNTGRPYKPGDKIKTFRSNYFDIPNEPLYPFGFGLSYTTFEYSEIGLNKEKMRADEEIKAKITIKNTGKYEGDEIIQLYIQDLYGSVVRPVKELKGFRKIHLTPGDSEKVVFLITKEKLSFWDSDMEYVAEPGAFKLYIGTNSVDIKEANLELLS